MKSKVFLILLLLVSTANADYEITWHTIDGGGGVSSGGPYVLSGTIGQPDAAYSAGGQYELLGGFWSGGPLCTVDFRHFARFAGHWLQEDCDELNDYCDGANLDYLGDVNTVDLGLFVDEWLNYCPYDWPLR
jgi:hypothetical protein